MDIREQVVKSKKIVTDDHEKKPDSVTNTEASEVLQNAEVTPETSETQEQRQERQEQQEQQDVKATIKEQPVQDKAIHNEAENASPKAIPSMQNDEHLRKAEDITEKTIDNIHKRMHQQEEASQPVKRDFTGVFLMLALLFSFGAMIFSIVNMLAPSGLSTAYYQKGVKFLNQNSSDQFKALKQELLDNGKALNNDTIQSINEIKTALIQISDNVKKLNQNMTQVQANISNQISSQSAPDLSALSQEIAELKTSVEQMKNQAQLSDVNNAFKPKVVTNNDQSANHLDIQYIGNSPNGAILKITDKEGKSKSANYVTVQAGQVTAYGKVSFLDDHVIVIDGKRIQKSENK